MPETEREKRINEAMNEIIGHAAVIIEPGYTVAPEYLRMKHAGDVWQGADGRFSGMPGVAKRLLGEGVVTYSNELAKKKLCGEDECTPEEEEDLMEAIRGAYNELDDLIPTWYEAAIREEGDRLAGDLSDRRIRFQ